MIKNHSTVQLVQLCVANNEMEADIIISMLDGEGILCHKQYDSSGEYLHIAAGYNFQGVIIKVPEDRLEEAQQILGESSFLDETEEVDDEFNNMHADYKLKRSRLIKIWLGLGVLGLILIISLVTIDNLI